MNKELVDIREILATAEAQLNIATHNEGITGEAIDSMNRAYWQGYVEALVYVIDNLDKVSA